MAAKKRRRKKAGSRSRARKTSKRRRKTTARRSRKKARKSRKGKGRVPLKILEKRLKRLDGIVRSRGGKTP